MSIPDKKPFPSEVKIVFKGLCSELSSLCTIWDTYKELYGTEETIEILNKTAPGAFGLIQRLFRNEFIMGICRLTDPVRTGKFENLTLDYLLSVIREKTNDTDFENELEEQKQNIYKIMDPFRTHRNKTLGHLDRETILNYRPGLLPGVNRDSVELAMNLLVHFMHTVQGYYTYIYFDFVQNMSGHKIVHCLKEFHRLIALEFKREREKLQLDVEERKKLVGAATSQNI